MARPTTSTALSKAAAATISASGGPHPFARRCKLPGDVANVRPSMIGLLTLNRRFGADERVLPAADSGLFRCPLRRRMSENKKSARLSEDAEYSGYKGVDDAQGYEPSPDGAEHGGAHMSNLTRRNLLAGAAVAALPPLAVPRAQAAAPLAEKVTS